MFDPFQGTDTAGSNPYPATVDTGAVSTDGSDGYSIGDFFAGFPKLAGGISQIISAGKGRPYQSGPYGVSSQPYYGQGVFGGGGISGGISTGTLMLFAGAALIFMMARK